MLGFARLSGLCLLLALASCVDGNDAGGASGADDSQSGAGAPALTTDPPVLDVHHPDPGQDPVDSDGGGTSGSEGSFAPCDETMTTVALDEVPAPLGFSAEALLQTVGGTHELSVFWHPLDAGPAYPTGEGVLTLRVAVNAATARSYVCDDPAYPFEVPPRLEVDVVVELRTQDGLLDERIETALSAERVDLAELAGHGLDRQPEALSGTLGTAVADYYPDGSGRGLRIEFVLREEGPTGVVMGAFSPHRSNPCRFREYATFPADRVGGCPYDQEPSRLEDDTLGDPLEKVNRSLLLVFGDGNEVEATLEVTPQGPTACFQDPMTSTRVDVRLTSARAGISFEGSGWLSALMDDGLEEVNVEADVALDAESLAARFGYDGDASAAVASMYLTVHAGGVVPVTELVGAFQIREVEREGFETPLPEVEIGAGAERCFDSRPGFRAPYMRAIFSLP